MDQNVEQDFGLFCHYYHSKTIGHNSQPFVSAVIALAFISRSHLVIFTSQPVRSRRGYEVDMILNLHNIESATMG